MASGALPPGFPAVEIDGEYYWDGGMVSNTPLSRVLNSEPRRDTLTFQVDLWSATGRQIGSAHVCTPVTTAHHVCRLLLEKKNHTKFRICDTSILYQIILHTNEPLS